MPNHRIPVWPRGPWGRPAACSGVTIASAAATCLTAGPLRLIAGLSLLAALACALCLLRRAQFDAIVPVTGLTLVFLVLAGLGLATVRSLSVVPTALTVGASALAAAWAAARFPAASRPARAARRGARGYIALAGVLVFAIAATLAVRYAAESATADSSQASSLAVWAYPVGDQLHVGAQQPDGHGAVLLRIVVTQAGATAATWNNILLEPGQAWEAPALTLTGDAPVRVVALRAGTVVATLSALAGGLLETRRAAVTKMAVPNRPRPANAVDYVAKLGSIDSTHAGRCGLAVRPVTAAP